MSDLSKLLQNTWIAARIKGELTLEFADAKEAHKYRFLLYKAVAKAKKEGKPKALYEAAISQEIIWIDEKTLGFAEKTPERVLTIFRSAIGEDFLAKGNKILAGESTSNNGVSTEADAEASMNNFLKQLLEESQKTQEPTPQRVTPYYTRDPGTKL